MSTKIFLVKGKGNSSIYRIQSHDGDNYVLVASMGGAPKHPVWYYNLKADRDVEIRDETQVFNMRVREIKDAEERARLWEIAVNTYPPYADYQNKTERVIPVFLAEPVS